jgi:hydroxypyruvate isomerase
MAKEKSRARPSDGGLVSFRTTPTELQHSLTRRKVLRGAAAAMALPVAAVLRQDAIAADQQATPVQPAIAKGRIKQSVCYWCFEKLGLETLAHSAAAMGIKSIELVPPEQWPILKRHGLICALTASHDFNVGWNHKENHAMCVEKTRQAIDATAAAGFPAVIAFSGLRKGLPDDVGLENTVAGLKAVVGYAERKKVTICLEALNSRVPQYMIGVPDYMCDRVEWAVEVCRRIASERMKVLFDIFHVQIMQGDLIARIRQYRDYIATTTRPACRGATRSTNPKRSTTRPL